VQFSICITCYNYGNKLSEVLNSALQQTVQDFEIIIVNDGSTDNSAEVAKTYQQKHSNLIHYIEQENQGPSAARNTAVKNAKGEFIFIVDADDQLLPNALSIFQKAIKANPQVEILISQHISVSTDGKEKIKKKPELSTNNEKNFIDYLRKRFTLAHGAHIVKRSVFEKFNYPESIRGREDIIFFAQILANYKAATINEATVKINTHANSLRHQFEQHHGSLAIASTLFDSKKLPKNCMKYQSEFTSQLCLSFFRSYYSIGNKRVAKQWYWRAVKANFTAIFQWKYLRKLLRCYF
jgi:glycosyltransferase involved in cell wall biosynthesis